MGAAKAGVTLVTFAEKNSQDALHSVLKESGARGLIYSSSTAVNDAKDTRQTFLQKLMPELHKMYPGDALNLGAYPMLKQLVQTGHTNYRGVLKFKDALVYANTALSGFTLP